MERSKAKELFGTFEEPTELARSIMAVRRSKSTGFVAGGLRGMNGAPKGGKAAFSEKEQKRFERLVKKAKTLSEIQKLEKAQAEGRLPAGLGDDDDDAMDES